MSDPTPVLHIAQLWLSRQQGRERREVLRGVSLSVAAGRICALMGVSGAGKSTVLRAAVALEAFDRGRIVVDGVALQPGPVPRESALRAFRRRVGMVFQQHALFPHLTVHENVTLAPVHALGTAPSVAATTADTLLATLGVSHRRDALPAQISGGEAQRVAIARALAMQPKVMLFDEVTSALDPELVGEVLRVIRDLANEGMTMILVTHEMHFARDVGDKLMFFDQGRILQQGAPKDVLDHPDSERLKTFLRRFSAANYL